VNFVVRGITVPSTALGLILVGFLTLVTSARPRGISWDLRKIGIFAEVPFAVMVLAAADSQEERYILPLLSYLALLVAWTIHAAGQRRVTLAVGLMFVSQWAFVQLGAFDIVPMRGPFTGPLMREVDPNERIIDQLAELEAAGPSRVLLALGGFDLYSLQVDYELFKRSGTQSSSKTRYESAEFILTRMSVGGDADRAWNDIVSWDPDYVVVMNEDLQNTEFDRWQGSAHGWRNVMLGSVALSDRVAASGGYELLPDVDIPDIAIYRQIRD
jgi:hypothetical protein